MSNAANLSEECITVRTTPLTYDEIRTIARAPLPAVQVQGAPRGNSAGHGWSLDGYDRQGFVFPGKRRKR